MMLVHEMVGEAEHLVQQHVWQPGNGTRYEIYRTATPEGQWMLVWPNRLDGARAFIFGSTNPREHEVMSYRYLQEKMKVNDADAAALLGFIEALGMAEVIYPQGFVAPGIWKGGA